MSAEPTEPVETSETSPEADDHATSSLKGTFVAVMLMAAFFVATWLGMLAIAMERR